MPSQEDYLDDLLKNMMSHSDNDAADPDRTDRLPEDAAPEELPDLDGITEELPDLDGLLEDLPDLDSVSEEELPDLDGITEGLPDLDGVSEEGLPDLGGITEELPDLDSITEEQPDLDGVSEGLPNLDGISEEELPDLDAMLEDMDLDAMLKDMDPESAWDETPGAEPDNAEALAMNEAGEAAGDRYEPEAEETVGSYEPETEEAAGDRYEPEAEGVVGSYEPEPEESVGSYEPEAEESVGSYEPGTEEAAGDRHEPESVLVPDLETVAGMSEEEINRLLDGDMGLDDAALDSGQLPEKDLLDMLDGTEDSDLQDIQQMLSRSDNNEAVDDEIAALLQDFPDETDQVQEEPAEEGQSDRLSPKEQKVLEKKRRREEKAAARQAAKAAKAAAKKAKAAEKAQAAAAKMPAEPTAQEDPVPEEAAADADDMMDMSFLDDLVSEAEGTDGTDGQSNDLADALDRPEESEQPDADAVQEAATGEEDGIDGLGFDMDSLFGDLGDESDPGSMEGGDPEFPDFVSLDAGDAAGPEEKKQGRGKGKKNLFARLFELFTEEDTEEENEEFHLSDENREILSDLDKEKTAGKKRKKKGKKAVPQQDEGSGEQGDAQDGSQQDSPQKEKKPKRRKKEKPQEEMLPELASLSSKKLSLKKVLPVLLVCASLGVFILVFVNAAVDHTDKQSAREAYYAGDYQTCYQDLFGKNLNETEQIMFGKSESILYIRLWLSEYKMFAEEGQEVEALDSLIQTVEDYPKLYEYAVQWNAGTEVQECYGDVLNILSEKYGLTEEQALEIAGESSDLEYTKKVVAIVEGRPFGSWNEPVPTQQPESGEESASLQDVLPEEDGLGGDVFIENR